MKLAINSRSIIWAGSVLLFLTITFSLGLIFFNKLGSGYYYERCMQVNALEGGVPFGLWSDKTVKCAKEGKIIPRVIYYRIFATEEFKREYNSHLLNSSLLETMKKSGIKLQECVNCTLADNYIEIVPSCYPEPYKDRPKNKPSQCLEIYDFAVNQSTVIGAGWMSDPISLHLNDVPEFLYFTESQRRKMSIGKTYTNKENRKGIYNFYELLYFEPYELLDWSYNKIMVPMGWVGGDRNAARILTLAIGKEPKTGAKTKVPSFCMFSISDDEQKNKPLLLIDLCLGKMADENFPLSKILY